METNQDWKRRYLPLCIIFPLLGLILGYTFTASAQRKEIGMGMVKASWTALAVYAAVWFIMVVLLG